MYPQIKFEFSKKGNTQYFWRPESGPGGGSNMSNAPAAVDSANEGSNGKRGFILSPSTSLVAQPLNDSAQMWSARGSYPGFISSDVVSIKDDVRKTYKFTLYGDSPRIMQIKFDSAANEYATNLVIGNSYNSNHIIITDNTSTQLTIQLGALGLPSGDWSGGIITLTINGWSRRGGSVRIVNVHFGTLSSWTIDGGDLIDFECSENMYDSQLNLTPGICEQYADIRFYDRYHTILSANLEQDCDVTIRIYDPEGVLGTYKVREWEIPGTSSEITAHCADQSIMLDKIKISSVNIQNRTVHALLTLLFSQGGGLPWAYLTSSDRNYCNRIYTPDCWFRADTLKNLLEKTCYLGMLRIYWKTNMFIVTRAWTGAI